MPQFDQDEMTGDEVIVGKEHDGRVTDESPLNEMLQTWTELTDEKLSFDWREEQPTAKMAKKHKEHSEYDNTSLDPSSYSRSIHRDYLAHVMRWGWITRQIKRHTATSDDVNVIEVGCGRELSLFSALRISVAIKPPALMTMVDINKTKTTKCPWADVRSDFDFVSRWPELQTEGKQYNVAVNTEVIEHITTPLGMAMLNGINKLLVDGGDFYISTPVFNGRRAVNHIREYTVAELQEMLEKSGFEVVKRYGTFASWNDIKRAISTDETLSEDEKRLMLARYNEAADFYGHDVMSCYAAPLYPDASRNNAWHCRKV